MKSITFGVLMNLFVLFSICFDCAFENAFFAIGLYSFRLFYRPAFHFDCLTTLSNEIFICQIENKKHIQTNKHISLVQAIASPVGV